MERMHNKIGSEERRGYTCAQQGALFTNSRQHWLSALLGLSTLPDEMSNPPPFYRILLAVGLAAAGWTPVDFLAQRHTCMSCEDVEHKAWPLAAPEQPETTVASSPRHTYPFAVMKYHVC